MNDQQKAIQDAIAQTMRELSQPKNPTQRSRVWKDPEGYKYLVSWSNSVILRYLIRLLTFSLPKSEYRRKAQLDDAARSVVRNQEEGFKRSTTKEYSDFVGFSQGSLEEVKGDIRELTEDGFLQSMPSSSLGGIGINLKDFHEALKPKGNLKEFRGGVEEGKGEEGASNNYTASFNLSSNHPLLSSKTSTGFLYQPLTILYPPLNKIKAEDLSYEIFIELINKTDYNLRLLVQSLEKKLVGDHKGYQIEQARIKDKFRK